ncbi:CBS domain-containing protein [bacterium]|nr:CBS domain-containing protein [bacterium]
MKARNLMVKARNLMVPLTDYLRPESTIKEAVNMLRSAKRDDERVGVKGLPVLDAGGKLVGILSMGDILKAVYPFYMPMMNLGDFTWDGMVESLARQATDRTVDNIMTKNVITIGENDSLMKCVDQMIKNKVHRLPVLDDSNKVVGMLYERDVFFIIVKAMLEEGKDKEK